MKRLYQKDKMNANGIFWRIRVTNWRLRMRMEREKYTLPFLIDITIFFRLFARIRQKCSLSNGLYNNNFMVYFV